MEYLLKSNQSSSALERTDQISENLC